MEENNKRIFKNTLYLYGRMLHVSKCNPGIIHFAAPIKPWFKDCQHPYRWSYKKYLKLTPWKGSRFPIFEQLTLWGRIKKIIRNFLNEIDILSDPMFTPHIKKFRV